MLMGGFPILSVLIFFPLVGVVIIAFINRENVNVIRWIAFIVSVIEFILSLELNG